MASSQALPVDEFCLLCHNVFDNKEFIPKKLNCSHSYCMDCIFERTKCPKCDEVIQEPFLHLQNFLNISKVLESGSLEELELEKERLAQMITTEWNAFNNVPILETPDEVSHSSCDTVFESKDDESDKDQCSSDFNSPPFNVHDIKENFSLSSIQDKVEFIDKIVSELLKGNRMYAFDSITLSGDVLWSSLSFEHGKLYIHSLTSDSPTMPALFVPFIDLKNCLHLDNCQTFIDISENRLICNMVTSSPLSYDFLKLCSGEDGATFKGLSYEIKRNSEKRQDIISLQIKDLNHIGIGYVFLEHLPSETKEPFEDKLYIKMWEDKCEIIINLEIPSSEESESDGIIVASAISSVEEFLHLSTEGNSCLEDCGLIIILPLGQQDTPMEPEPLPSE